ncbi:MAG: Two-component system sensor histidine kinase [uncultured Solirubrobacteraceae bacterium]|uniref:histidine kinase n=1 Tax=uncultured Solirubrobacteraceae bacterium TaxID=1162706 RepID=A0A6J4SR53_9ACTN|nr:MAG: Two-component system sensor histidine kinase [uncultured Solirubrobacteraceae bacterium]
MRRGLAFAVLAAAFGGGLAAAVHGSAAGITSLLILLPLGCATVFAAHAIVAARTRIGGLRRQFGLLAAVAAAQLAIAVGVFVELMFVSRHDAFFAVLVAGFTGTLSLWAGRLLGRRALTDVEAVRTTLGAVGQGRRDVRTNLAGHDELARLGADVDAMVSTLAFEERARRGLIASISHDLRTPLTSLRLLVDAIDDDLVADAAMRRDYLRRISTNVHALSALIEDLFELSRLESGDIRWTMERVMLDELVQETIDAMRPHADARAVAVHAELAPRLAAAQANPEQIQRVLFNLIQNAIRHTPADGSVVVRAAPATEGAIEIEVADTGTGIAGDKRDRVFEPFFRGTDHDTRSDDGAGLGLSISRAIIEAHGGRIWLADAASGTSVRFRLPSVAGQPAR